MKLVLGRLAQEERVEVEEKCEIEREFKNRNE